MARPPVAGEAAATPKEVVIEMSTIAPREPSAEAAPKSTGHAEGATRDFALTSKTGWRRGVSGLALGAPLIPPLCFVYIFAGLMLSKTVVGAAVGVPLAVIGTVGLVEAHKRKKQAGIFKKLFEGDGLPKENQIANQVIESMKPEINTDQFIGVVNNLLMRKKISEDLVELTNKKIKAVQETIWSHYFDGYKGKENQVHSLDDKAVLQFLLLNSVVEKLTDDPALLPNVSRPILNEKFAEFGSKFLQHCQTRYPKETTEKCRENIISALPRRGHVDGLDAEVLTWATGRVDLDNPLNQVVDGQVGGGGGDGKTKPASRVERVAKLNAGENPAEQKTEQKDESGAAAGIGHHLTDTTTIEGSGSAKASQLVGEHNERERGT